MRYFIWPLLIIIIGVRYFLVHPVYKEGDKVRITSTVYADPAVYPTSQLVKISNLKVYLPVFPTISYGDTITVEGTVNKGKLAKPKLISLNQKNNWSAVLRNAVISFYQTTLPEPMAGLMAGTVIGSKGALPKDFYEKTKIAGVAHVVVASGTNITFVASFLMASLTLFLTRRKAIIICFAGIIFYLFISGFDAPLVRAAIMSSFIFLGQEKGKLVSTWRVFFLTAAIMLIYKPVWLKDLGFILSFVSTGSLMLFERRINAKLLKVPRLLREGLSTSVAAQIGVAPILFITFGQFNPLSPVINAFVLWTIPGIMILGSLGGLIGLVIPILGKGILWLAYPLLWWFVKVVEIFN